MEQARNRLESTRYIRERTPISPTAFPGATAVEEAEASVFVSPLFPDMRRDEYMSKSTISSKELGSVTNNYNTTNGGGDHWSVSTTSDDHYRSQQQHYDSDPRRHSGRRSEREVVESREYESRGRNDHSLERRTRERYADTQLRCRSNGRPQDRFQMDDYEGSRSQYDTEFDDRRRGRHDEKSYDRFHPLERTRQQEMHRPQHLYPEDDDFGPIRRDRLESRIPRTRSPRQPLTPSKSDRVYDRDYSRRTLSPTRTDYARGYADEDQEYDLRLGRGRSKSPRDWNASTRIREGRLRFRDESSDEDDAFAHPRSESRRRSTSREMGKLERSQHFTPYETSVSRGRGSRYDDLNRATSKSRPKLFRYEVEDDEENDFIHKFESIPDQRKSRRTVRYEEDLDDDSSVSSLNVESGTSQHLEELMSSRARSPSRFRSIEIKPQRHKSKSRERKAPMEFVIDIAQSFDDDRDVTFSPSTEAPHRAPIAPPTHASEDHVKRIADANLMKEQSEARHQILKEIRQAMEMRDLTHDEVDRQFWDRQVKTLNASLKNLWDHHIGYQDVSNSAEYGQASNNEHTMPLSVRDPHVVNNFTTVKVQAPDNLPGGHQFTIRVNGKPLKAQVPAGGVRKGDVFTIRFPLNNSSTPVAPPLSPTMASATTVKVRAPASLPAGYRFTAKMGDRTIVATVPPGGVQKGEIFTVPVMS